MTLSTSAKSSLRNIINYYLEIYIIYNQFYRWKTYFDLDFVWFSKGIENLLKDKGKHLDKRERLRIDAAKN